MPSNTQIFVVACVFAFFVPEGHAAIIHRRIVADTRDHRRVALRFGFDKGGVIELNVTDLVAYTQTKDAPVDLFHSGFFLADSDWDSVIMDKTEKSQCYLEDEITVKLMDLSQWTSDVNNISSVMRFEKEDRLQPGEYSLYYTNCNDTIHVSCHIRVAMYNIDANGNKDYLSIGYRPLPSIYMLVFLAFSMLAMTWAKVCHTERLHVQSIHYLVLGMVVLRSVTYFAMAEMYRRIRTTGSPEGWNVPYYIVGYLRGIMFFVIMALIGAGWPYLCPSVGKNTMRFLVVKIPLQVWASVPMIILDETFPARPTLIALTDLVLLVDIVCYGVVLFPVVRSIKHLEESAASDAEAAAYTQKLALLRQFYRLLMFYTCIILVVVYPLVDMLPYSHKWINELVSALVALAFYIATGVRFRPHGEKEYLKLESEPQGGDKSTAKQDSSPTSLDLRLDSPGRDEV